MNTTLTTTTDKALAAVESGTIAFSDLLRAVAKRDTDSTPAIIDLPKPVVVTAEQDAALSALSAVVASAVTPTDRRLLSADEMVALMEERGMLDAVAKVIDARKEAQRSALFNHFDVEAESVGAIDADRDSKGHYLSKAEAVVPSSGKKFTREVRQASPTLTAEALLEQVNDDSFTHDDYLACTTQVRVVDEAKVMLHLRKKPEIVSAIARATVEGNSTASLYVRKG